jgi:cytochrome b561
MAHDGPPPRYGGAAQLLHWVTTAALFLMLPFVWVAENFPDGPTKVFWYLLHESFGLCILLLVIARVTWRFVRPPTDSLRAGSRLMDLVARANHGLLYAVLMVMPVTGYLIASNGQPVPFFGIVSLPGLPKNDALALWADTIHVYAQFALYAAFILHLAGTVWHVAVLRDGLLDRMLPAQRPPGRPEETRIP